MKKMLLNALFVVDGIWHVWALANHQINQTLVSKFLLCFILFVLLLQQLGDKFPIKILTAILFCLAGDVLLHPLDLDYADMTGTRPIHFLLGVLCFCVAYGSLLRYYLQVNPDWRAAVRAKPAPLIVNVVLTVALLMWMTMNNQAPTYLVPVVWLYSPIVVGAATLAFYTQHKMDPVPFVMLVLGSNLIVLSDTVIGLTALPKLSMPWFSNPVWILGTYIIGILLVFNAILSYELKYRHAT